MQIVHGNSSGVRQIQLPGLVLRGENSGPIAGTPRSVLAVHDISICSARPDGHQRAMKAGPTRRESLQ